MTREEFVGVTRNAVAGLGFDQDASMVVFPIDLFLVDSDLSPVDKRFDEIIDGLTEWSPAASETGVMVPPAITVEANGFEAAFDQINRSFIANGWGDGLPVVPPTEERVKWILSGTDRPADGLIGKVMPRGGIASVETLAVSLAMAGGRPEYLPVLIAAVEAVLAPELEHDKFQATSGSTFPVVIVNGPIASDIRLNSGFGLLGPDPQHPAGASIGRAMRFLLQNVGGALPGVGTMAIFGAMRFTNLVFAEDEAGLPEGWLPLAVERGFAKPGENAVTVYIATGAANVMRRGVGKEAPYEEAIQGLRRTAHYIRVPNAHYPRSHEAGTPGAVLIPCVVARQLAAHGWTSKAAVREFLWEHSKIPRQEIEEDGMLQWIEQEQDAITLASGQMDPWPICHSPDQFLIAVAGGEHPTHNFWMQAWGPKVAGRRIETPGRWDQLIADAEIELGAGGEHCEIG